MRPACLYRGAVTHERRGAVAHRLKYKIAYVFVDLDSLEGAQSPTWMCGFNKPGPMSVFGRDHGEGKSDDLANWVRNYLFANGVTEEAARISLLTLPRMFGFVFNPVSFYFIRDGDRELHHILCEVNNTIGGRWFHLIPVKERGRRVKHKCTKEFYVSPFLEMDGRYNFRISVPAEKIAIGIEYGDECSETKLIANLTGDRAPLNAMTCINVLVALPLMTIGVLAAIYWEALKLWLKGAKFNGDPQREKRARRKRQTQTLASQEAE